MATDATTKTGTACHQFVLIGASTGKCITEQVVRLPDGATDKKWDGIAEDFQDEMSCVPFSMRKRKRCADFATCEIPDCDHYYEALFDEEDQRWLVSPVHGFCDDEREDDEN